LVIHERGEGFGEPVPILCDSSGSYSRDYFLDQSQIVISHVIGEWNKGRILESIRDDAPIEVDLSIDYLDYLDALYPEVDLD